MVIDLILPATILLTRSCTLRLILTALYLDVPRFKYQGAGKIDFRDQNRSEGTFWLYDCHFHREDGDALVTGTFDVLVLVRCFVASDTGETFDYEAYQLFENITVKDADEVEAADEVDK